ncbi:MAG TPA: protein-export chaperone SecB [Xanthobacteraceae bacterium]
MPTQNGEQPVGQPQGATTGPQLNVLAQYIKDLSFENPNAPKSLMPRGQQPAISIQINVAPNQLSNTDFEVELKLEGKAEVTGQLLFNFELVYAGVFRLQNIPQENIGPLVMIECPRLLFPFAREIVAKAVVAGGFPPLMLDPVDFVALYRQKLSQAQPQPAAAGTN